MKIDSDKEFQVFLHLLSQLLLEENELLRNSMQRIDSVLKHAIELLNENVYSVNGTLQRQQDEIHHFLKLASNKSDDKTLEMNESLQKIFQYTVASNTTLSNTIRSLQMEDIVSQISAHIVNHSFEIDQTFHELKTLNKSNGNAAELNTNALYQVTSKIKLLRESAQNHSTKQVNLDIGDIELF